jgi:hypothetical protein
MAADPSSWELSSLSLAPFYSPNSYGQARDAPVVILSRRRAVVLSETTGAVALFALRAALGSQMDLAALCGRTRRARQTAAKPTTIGRATVT